MRVRLIIASLFVLTTAVAQKQISGITPEKTLMVGSSTLKFNGAGLREKFFLDLYVGSLYVKTSTKDAKYVINADEPMAITLDIVSGLITREKMINAINEGFENSTDGNTDKFKNEIKEFTGAFSEEIKEGHNFEISYVPGEGTILKKNGKHLKKIPGLAFKKAVFGIWFCDEPADEGLMEDMLGL